jgi:OmpA-OmpF porin, OOP family
MRHTLTLPAIALLALVTAGCGNRLSQPMAGPTPQAVTPQSAQSTLNTGGQAGGPLVPGNYPPSVGTTAPPPAAAPAPAARDFTLYFDTNKATLSSDARSIVQQAAAAAKQGPMTHIAVTGHTDTVGTTKYNQGLSVRRADAVRKELIADGIAADQITAKGVGKSELAVPTADGVNEPRNRRAVITEGGPGM